MLRNHLKTTEPATNVGHSRNFYTVVKT